MTKKQIVCRLYLSRKYSFIKREQKRSEKKWNYIR